MRLKISLVLITLSIGLSVFSQQKTITGTVSDATGTLPGVNVIIKGTTTGTDTDFDGKYSIKATEGDVLVFSYLGYKTKEVTIASSTIIDIMMSQDNEVLEEVVVVAFGTRKREEITGSVQAIDAKTIENQQVTSPLRALQGTVPGVNILTQGGQPGNNPQIAIRGFGSLNSSTAPLIVVDGAPFNGNLNTISQDQIESISTLKDASSASLYGSRAANGVLIITTKRGKRNSKAKVSVRSQYGLSNPAVGIHSLVGSEDYLKLNWQAIRNNNIYQLGQTPTEAAQNATNQLIPTLGYNPYSVNNPIDTDGNLVNGANLLWNTSWQDVILRDDVPRQNHNISISGGGENNNYFVSLDYLNEEGPVIVSDFERIALRGTIDADVNNWFKVGLTSSFSRSYSNNPDQTSSSTIQAISWIYSNSSIYPIYVRDENGNLILDDNGQLIYDLGNGNGRPPSQSVNSTRPGVGGENILASIELGTETRIRSNFIGSVYAEAKLFENLKFRTTFNYENFLFDSHSFQDDLVGAASGVNGRVTKQRNITTTLNAIQALNYTDSFGKHNVSADLIYESNTLTNDTFRASATGFLPGQEELGNGTNAESFGGFRLEQRITGILGRISYNFNNKYFFDGSFRRDKTSQFDEEFRTGNFFSLGASWSIHKESFLSNIEWINNLRLRASYGELGNVFLPDNTGTGFFPTSFLYRGFNFGNISLSPVEGNPALLNTPDLIDPLLTWETSSTTNIGLDFDLFNNIITGTIEYYKRNSVDLVQDLPVSGSLGVNSLRTNVGEVENRGLEVSLTGNVINKPDVQWSINGNISTLKNELIELGGNRERFINGSKLWSPGNSIFEFYIREWAGVDPDTGDALWYQDVVDAQGNVTGRTTTNNYDTATRYQTGKESIPSIQGGLGTNFRYKNFDFSVLFNFSFGGYLLDTDYSSLVANMGSIGSAAHPDNFLAWQQPGDITDFPRLTIANNSFNNRSTRWLFKNDYIRMRNISAGYNLPTEVLEKHGISKLRFYVLGENMFTWQSHTGIDPEQAFNGLTNRRSPLLKTLTFGAQIEF